MLSSLLLLLGAALARPAPPSPEAVPPPTVPTDERTPLSDQVDRPGLGGSTTSLDLESLTRTRTTFTLEVDASAIGLFDEAGAEALASHLAADPRWRVTTWEGATVAWQRLVRGRERSVRWDGLHRWPHEAWRVGLRFGAWPDEATWAGSPWVSMMPVDEPALELDTFVLGAPHADWIGTALTVQGPHLALDVYEAGRGKGREHSVEALVETLPLLAGLHRDTAVAAERGHVPWYLPAGEPDTGGPSLVVTTPGRGLLEIRARVNPGEPGWAWARLLDTDLHPWREEALAACTRERVGWSTDGDARFYLQAICPVPRGGRFSATAEIWFQPDDGGPARRLDAGPLDVPGR